MNFDVALPELRTEALEQFDLLNGEIFYTLKEAKVLIERWRQQYNRMRPHSSLGYRPPAPEALLLKPATLRFAGLNNPLSAPSY